MTQHTFNIKINTPDSVTEQEIINKFCKYYKYDNESEETKAHFLKRLVGEHILQAYKGALKQDKELVAQQELETELQGITTE